MFTIVETGKEIKIGEYITTTFEKRSGNSWYTHTMTQELTEELAKDLVAAGLLVDSEEKAKEEIKYTSAAPAQTVDEKHIKFMTEVLAQAIVEKAEYDGVDATTIWNAIYTANSISKKATKQLIWKLLSRYFGNPTEGAKATWYINPMTNESFDAKELITVPGAECAFFTKEQADLAIETAKHFVEE